MSISPGPAIHTTRLRSTTTLKKTRKELEEVNNISMTIKSKQQAIAYLTTGDYIPQGASVDPHILAHVLLQFSVTNKMTKMAMDSIRAVAFLMEKAYA